MKKGMKNLLSLLLALCLLAGVAALAEDVIVTAPVEDAVEEAAVELAGEDAAADAANVVNAGDIAIDEAHFPDANFRAYIVEEIDNGDGVLSAAECETVKMLEVDERGIKDLTGIEYFTSLEMLFSDVNQLTALDVSHNTNLELLACAENKLTNLKLGKNAKLRDLYCSNNQLKTLDVSGNKGLEWMECAGNQIKTLDLAKCPYLILCAKEKPKKVGNELRFFHFEETDEGDEREYHLFVDPGVILMSGSTVLYGEASEEPVSIAGAKVTVKDQTYTGKALKPAPVVKLDGETLKKGTDYTVSYKKNTDIGTATLTVKGKGNYTGTAKATFKINPKAVTLTKLTAGTKQLTAQWKKGAGDAGYQLQYSLKKDFSAKTTVTITKNATVKKVVKKLKSGKKYYVRLRAYKKAGGKAYVSAWSKAKSVKVK